MNKTYSFSDWLSEFDGFGVPVGLMVEGKRENKTAFGGILTMLVFALSITYGGYLLFGMIVMSKTTFTSTSIPDFYNQFHVIPAVNGTDVNFNVAFGVFTSDLSTLENFAKYFTITANLFSYAQAGEVGTKIPMALLKDKTWTTVDNLNFYKDLKIHKCTNADNANFYDPNTNYETTINEVFPSMFCLENLEQINFYGNFNTDNSL